MELISIVDCALCVALLPDQHVQDWELPLPETWGRLETILVRRGWEKRWYPPPAPDVLDFEEIRVCRACGTHYHYRQVYDSHSGEPRAPETDWYLSRLTPTGARAYYIDHTNLNGVVEHLDGGWLVQHYQTIIELLRRDFLRTPDLQLKGYMVGSLYEHYVSNQDWEGLRSTLIDCPDPGVGVYVASMIFFQTDPEHWGRRLSSTWTLGDKVRAILRAEPARERLLVTVLAQGLSAQGQMQRFHYTLVARHEPVAVAVEAMKTLRTYVPRNSLAPAIPSLTAELQRSGSTSWWREGARDLLIKYVGATRKRAKEVLKALVGDSQEALAVRTHCQTLLG
jgi:hypothetical protein